MDEQAKSDTTQKSEIYVGRHMSNSAYHREGQPTWWARIGSGESAQFLDIPFVRGDKQLYCDVDVPPGTVVHVGCGKGKDKIRLTVTSEVCSAEEGGAPTAAIATITVDLDSANGPRVIADKGVDAAEIEAALPAGWTVGENWHLQVETSGGRYSYPLVRTESETSARLVSLDNGNSTTTVADLTDAQIDRSWSALVSAMADVTRESVHAELAPCTNRAFLARYLELAPNDLVIG